MSQDAAMIIESTTVEEATQRLHALGVKITAPTLREGIAQRQFPFGNCHRQC